MQRSDSTVAIGTFKLTLPGPMLRRGFWLYVWRVLAPDGSELLYVGRTGDNSSPNAAPAYIRMGQHLGSAKNQNALRKHLTSRKIEPEECRKFDLVAHGPIHPEVIRPAGFDPTNKSSRAALMKSHLPFRNEVGALEKRLAEELSLSGYNVMNVVKWSHSVDDLLWQPIREAFSVDFPKLGELQRLADTRLVASTQ